MTYEFTTFGALVGLVIAIVLIIKKVHPAYSLIIGAVFGGIIGGATKGAKISDCSSSVYVKMTAPTSKTNGCAVHFGGIAGRLYGGNVEIKHCTNSGRQQNNHYNNNIW